ncbi:hypothetical protein LJC19_07565 [Oxalobacter sp. OttesenSCG-928-P03]|nr:hypothetical protein [Oxalobacter sp. OttesenSCG-928-P03]
MKNLVIIALSGFLMLSACGISWAGKPDAKPVTRYLPKKLDYRKGDPRHNVMQAANALKRLGYRVDVLDDSGYVARVLMRLQTVNGKFTGASEIRIQLNKSNALWMDPEENTKIGYQLKIFSSPHPMHVLFHELAHIEYCAQPLPKKLSGREVRIAESLSDKAAMDGKEYVAEYVARKRAGLKTSAEMDAMFSRFTKVPTPSCAIPGTETFRGQ